ncbi:MAG: hypothetical protein PHZ00_02605 [Candidatus Peribacteraceae bacterium]|nr:hypothetical protein [Candidatus Peribacteraceae bacterium]
MTSPAQKIFVHIAGNRYSGLTTFVKLLDDPASLNTPSLEAGNIESAIATIRQVVEVSLYEHCIQCRNGCGLNAEGVQAAEQFCAQSMKENPTFWSRESEIRKSILELLLKYETMIDLTTAELKKQIVMEIKQLLVELSTAFIQLTDIDSAYGTKPIEFREKDTSSK